MKTCEREVRVTEGERLIQVWRCPEPTLPDGSAGVLWRGLSYRLLNGDRIDVSAPAGSNTDLVQLFAFIPGDDFAWVLVPGTETCLRSTRQRLEGVGIGLQRYGRWLGEVTGSATYDWFLCCHGPIDGAIVRNALAPVTVVDEPPAFERLRALQARAEALRAHVVASARPIPQPAISRSPETEQHSHNLGATATEERALLEALGHIEVLKAEVEALRTCAAVALPSPALRLLDELRTLMSAMRPDVGLVRDSWQVLAGAFRSRDGFWRAVRELPADGGRPPGWKILRGAERWWERHVSNGQDDSGRAYARFDTGARRWEVLLGTKGEQDQDIAWLKRRG